MNNYSISKPRSRRCPYLKLVFLSLSLSAIYIYPIKVDHSFKVIALTGHNIPMWTSCVLESSRV